MVTVTVKVTWSPILGVGALTVLVTATSARRTIASVSTALLFASTGSSTPAAAGFTDTLFVIDAPAKAGLSADVTV